MTTENLTNGNDQLVNPAIDNGDVTDAVAPGGQPTPASISRQIAEHLMNRMLTREKLRALSEDEPDYVAKKEDLLAEQIKINAEVVRLEEDLKDHVRMKELFAMTGGSSDTPAKVPTTPLLRMPTNMPFFRTDKPSPATDLKDPVEFCDLCSDICIANKISMKDMMPGLVPQLSYRDRGWLRTYLLSNPTWEECRASFIAHFQNHHVQDDFAEQLTRFRQKANEKMQKYSDRFLHVMNMAGKSPTDASVCRDFVAGLEDGLLANYATMKLMDNHENMRSIMDIAQVVLSMEGFLELRAKRTQKKVNPTKVDKEEEATGKGSKGAQNNGSVTKKLVCWNCDMEGHKSDACTSPKRTDGGRKRDLDGKDKNRDYENKKVKMTRRDEEEDEADQQDHYSVAAHEYFRANEM